MYRIDTHVVYVCDCDLVVTLYYRICIWAGLNHVWVSIDLYTTHTPEREGRVERASNNIRHRYISQCVTVSFEHKIYMCMYIIYIRGFSGDELLLHCVCV